MNLSLNYWLRFSKSVESLFLIVSISVIDASKLAEATSSAAISSFKLLAAPSLIYTNFSSILYTVGTSNLVVNLIRIVTGWLGPNYEWHSACIYDNIAYLFSSVVYSSTAFDNFSIIRFNAFITLLAYSTLLLYALTSAALASLINYSYSLRIANYFSYVSIVSLRITISSANV